MNYKNWMEKWRNRNLYYYKDLEKFFRFSTRPGYSVLEVGSRLGYLLAAVNPSYGLGIDRNSEAVEDSQKSFPELEFQVENIEYFKPLEKFDYIFD